MFKKDTVVLITALFGWIVASIFCLYFKQSNLPMVSALLLLIGESGLYLAIVICTFYLMVKSAAQHKILFLLLAMAFSFAFVSAVSFNYLVNINRGACFDYAALLADAPFTIFLLIQTVFWIVLFIKSGVSSKNSFFHYLSFSLAGAIIFVVFIFGIRWKMSYFSTIGLYQTFDTLLESIGFIFVSFCLIRSNTLWIKYLSIGYLVLISTDLLLRYDVIEKLSLFNSSLETIWALGLVIVLLSLIFLIKKRRLAGVDIIDVVDVNSLRAKVGMWIFIFSTLPLVIFVLVLINITAHTNNVVSHPAIKIIAPLIICLSIFSSLLSNYLSAKLSKPFEALVCYINDFNKTNGPSPTININTNILEVENLKNFIIRAFKVKHEKY
ncbi:MAG: hypothetical protein JKY13_03850, partial [Gammaproteobacteria bacterium]|nr:hypothetical protein [Gammaproteobacteria bacterium]